MRSEPPAPTPDTTRPNHDGLRISANSARAIAKEAFVFLYPLVANYGNIYSHAINTSAPTYSGGLGTWQRLGPAGRAQQEPAASPARMRFRAWFDLRTEPQALRLPASQRGRILEGSCFDLWSYWVTDIESAGTDGEVSTLLLTSPLWFGDPPVGVDRVVHGESSFLMIELSTEDAPRSRAGTDERLPAIKPLSALLGHDPLPLPPPVNWWPWRPGIETTHEFWACGNFALTLTTPQVQDRPLLERISKIGLVAGDPWDPLQWEGEIIEAIDAGMDDAVTELMLATRRPDDHVRQGFSFRREVNPDYLARALNALVMLPPPTVHIASG
jgi:hypothetical protein